LNWSTDAATSAFQSCGLFALIRCGILEAICGFSAVSEHFPSQRRATIQIATSRGYHKIEPLVCRQPIVAGAAGLDQLGAEEPGLGNRVILDIPAEDVGRSGK
jgi:hypothetical protein